MIPKKLSTSTDQLFVIEHLQRLRGEDRRLRFGGAVTDEFIERYVKESWDKEDSQWFGCISKWKIVSACHVAIYNGEAELGCSVDPKYRGRGLAQVMFDRAVTYLRTKDILNVYMHCLTENQVMRHIAQKNDMVVVSCQGESDAKVEVEAATPLTAYKDAYLDRMALYDMIIRNQSEMFDAFLEPFYEKRKTNID